jgi:hypothetical protein
MKTLNKHTKSYHPSVYNPSLDYLEDKIIFKTQLDEAILTLRKFGLPKELINRENKKACKS